jgi:hypothetical protein
MVINARYGSIPHWFVGALALSACAYQPDSFSHVRQPFEGAYVTVNCLDVALKQRKVAQPTRNIIEYHFANRCDEPAVVDLAAARVYGRTSDGAASKLFAFDPFHELRELRIDARAAGQEAIEYPSGEAIAYLCVDAAPIAHAGPSRWLCFDNRH